MAKPFRYAGTICTILSVIALIGIFAGLLVRSPILTMIFLLPTILYEVYRTEGASTKTASIILLLVFIVELILIVFNIGFNLATFLEEEEKYIAGYTVPLGDIRVVGPAVMAVLSIILFVRAYGAYTKWLAVIIFVTCFAIVYTLDPTIFKQLIKYGVEYGLNRIY